MMFNCEQCRKDATFGKVAEQTFETTDKYTATYETKSIEINTAHISINENTDDDDDDDDDIDLVSTHTRADTFDVEEVQDNEAHIFLLPNNNNNNNNNVSDDDDEMNEK